MRRLPGLLVMTLAVALAGAACQPAVPPPAAPAGESAGPTVPAAPAAPAGAGAPGSIVAAVPATVVPPPAPPPPIAAAAFVGAGRGWLARGAEVLATADGGATWTRISGLDSPATYLDFVSDTGGWAVTAGGLRRTGDGGATWQPVAAGGAGAISRVDFVDAETGWAGGDGGIIATRDSGATWAPVTDPCAGYAAPPQPFSFIDADHGWMVCGGGSGAGQQLKGLYRTADGGRSWDLLAGSGHEPGVPDGLPGSGYVADLYFLDPDHGWLAEGRGGLLATADGGRTWRHVWGVDLFLRDARFVSPEQGYVIFTTGGQPRLMATRDGGAAWTQVYPDPDTEPRLPMAVIDAVTALTGGTALDPGAILRTGDGGRTWQQVSALAGEVVLDLSFTSRLHGWALTDRWDGDRPVRSLYRTDDGGATWTLLPPGPQALKDLFHRISFVNLQTGFAASGWGHLFRTDDGGLTFTAVDAGDRSPGPVRFVTADHGWRLSGTTIEATADGGRTWTDVPLDARAWQLDLTAPGTAWVVAEDCAGAGCRPVLLTTADGGRTWTRFDLGPVTPRQVWMVDEARGWLADDQSHLYTTADGGRTWVWRR